MRKDDDAILSTSIAGLPLRNPVILAAGTAGYLDELSDAMDLADVGAVVTKSITALPREGNATWRILPSEAGMLNAIGLANVGIDAFARDVAPRITSVPTRVIASIAGYSIDEYVKVAAIMDDIEALDAVELNVSCPNVHGGCEFGADPAQLRTLIAAVRPALARVRLFVKLSPVAVAVCGVGIAQLAQAAIEGDGHAAGGPARKTGADALCLCNTIPAMAINVHTRRPELANVTGGMSGPAVHPVTLKVVHDAYRKVCKDAGVPIVGVGGVLRWEHAAEFVLAGASAVQVGTGTFADPGIPARVVSGLAGWARAQGVARMAELVGALAV